MSLIVLIGASGHARLLIEVVEKEGRHRIAGLLDRGKPRGTDCMGYEVLGAEADLPRVLAAGAGGALIAIGDNRVRAQVAAKIESIAPGIEFVNAIHPSAQIARGVEIGAGSVVMAGAVVNSNAVVGRHAFISTKASLDHDSVMAAFSSLGPGATCGGNVEIGEYSAVAIGATVLHGRRIGSHTVVGAGALVVRDIPDLVVAYGVPARVIRGRNPGESYL